MSNGSETIAQRCRSGRRHHLFYPIPAIILYPSLMTPQVIVNSDAGSTIELLLLVAKGYTLSNDNVNLQLKITQGLDPAKSFSFRPLSDLDDSVRIHFDTIEYSEDKISTYSCFSGILDVNAFNMYRDVEYTDIKYTQLFKVSVSNTRLLSTGTNNLFWIYPRDGRWYPIPTAGATPAGGTGSSHTHTLNRVEPDRIVPNEIQDEVIGRVLSRLNGPRIPQRGQYCFRLTDDDVDHTEIDMRNPIQSYHPVVVFGSGVQYLNLGHATDIHVAARQTVLARSKARVIEYPVELPEAPAQGSPPSQSGSQTPEDGAGSDSQSESTPAYDIYVVQSGDWLSKIAQRYGMTWRELWHYDGGTGIPNSRRVRSGDPDEIYPGEELVVPYTGPPKEEREPVLSVSPGSLVYQVQVGGADPAPQQVTVENSGDGILTWSAAAAHDWVTPNPSSGTATSTMNVGASAQGKNPGSYTSSVVVSSEEASNSPETVTVTLIVTAPPEAVADDSPPIGSMVKVTSRTIKELLTKIGQDPNIHVLVITGDLIDFVRMLYPDRSSTTVKQVWDQVALDDSYDSRYQDYVDSIALYTMFVWFYNRFNKPIYAVTGNHDAYALPYGISPRVAWVRANPGIGADHNLTLYEAILVFGETYGRIVDTDNFKADRMWWFYTAYTPFADFAVSFPSQTIVGMSWGDEEDILDPPFFDQGFGHLPRADDPVTDKQLSLLRAAIAGRKNVIFTSHFTFVSYLESIPMSTSDEGDVEFDTFWDAGDYDQGTFETNRKTLYEECLVKQKSIQVVLTGHSHRRGFYTINRADYAGDNSVKTSYYDFPAYAGLSGDGRRIKPIVIVSDSGGPHPRLNKAGEFNGQGSDFSAGSKICFDPTGDVGSMDPIRVSARPRIAVAVDYYDLLENNPTFGRRSRVISTFESDPFAIRDEHRGLVSYAFKIEMLRHITSLVWLQDVIIYAYAADGEWKRVPLQYDGARRWVIQRGRDARNFFNFVVGNHERANFMSMKFAKKSHLVSHYDFDSRWNFEIQIDYDTWGGGLFGSDTHKKYMIERDADRAEIPDFEWRRRFEKYR